MNSAFNQRFGPVGEALASVLRVFSMDVVSIVAGYAVCGVAKAGAKAQLLFSFVPEEFQRRPFYCMRSSFNGEQIWIGSANGVIVFDCDGNHLFSTQESSFGDAFDLAFDANGLAYVCSGSRNNASVLSPDGTQLRTLDAATRGYALAMKGDLLYSAHPNNCCISVFHRVSGALVRHFGGRGSADGQFGSLAAVAVSAEGEIFASDDMLHRIQVFNAEGKFLRKFGREGSGAGEFRGPEHMTIDRAGNILVSDQERVQVLTKDGVFITEVVAEGQVPYCMDLDCNGRILLANNDEFRGINVFAFEAEQARCD